MTETKLTQIKTAIKDGKLVQSAGGITETVTQSDKLGFDWKNIYVNDILVRREYVEQAIKYGTVDNPIPWEPGMVLIQNAYYVYIGETKVWMGNTGTTADWSSSDFVTI